MLDDGRLEDDGLRDEDDGLRDDDDGDRRPPFRATVPRSSIASGPAASGDARAGSLIVASRTSR